MPLAHIDIRPFILVAALPLLLAGAWLYTRTVRHRAGYGTVAFGFLMTFLAAYQFVFYGPFIDQHRVVHAPAAFTTRTDSTGTIVEFYFKSLQFGPIHTRDADVIAHVGALPTSDVDVAVELTYDFGRVRGMKLTYAYADGILFRPE